MLIDQDYNAHDHAKNDDRPGRRRLSSPHEFCRPIGDPDEDTKNRI